VLAYVFERPEDEAFLKLKALLEPLSSTHYYTQKIEPKHLTLRTRIKHLVR
jgi:hypothetical protein